MRRDSWLEENDIRALERLLYRNSPPVSFHDSVRRCLHNDYGFANELQFPTKARKTIGISIKDMECCIDMSKLRSHFQKKKGYRLKMGTDVTFHMLGDDYQATMDQLQSTRDRRTKFVCLNDDMKSPSIDVRLALRHLLEDLWPVPSTFELQTRSNEGHRALSRKEVTSSYLFCILILLFGSILVLSFLLRVSESLSKRKTT